MASVGTYLNYPLKTEEAFNWYASIFEPATPPYFLRFSDTPMGEGLPAEERNGIMHASMDIIGGHKIMATDMLKSMGHEVKVGNNTTITLTLDSNEDADRLYALLADGSSDGSGMKQEFFGYWGSCLAKFGIRWMLVVPTN